MTSDAIWAVVPVKSLGAAKQRLAPMLAPHQRRALMFAMFADVLATLVKTPALHGILVISPDPEVLAQAARAGAQCEQQSADIGHAATADDSVTLVAERHGATGIMIVPADTPLVTPADYASIIAAHITPGWTIVPSWDDGGTNCVLLNPPAGMTFLFGPDSLRRHLHAAAEHGIAARVVRNHNIAHDIDDPLDLLRLPKDSCGPNTQDCLETLHPIMARSPTLQGLP